MRIHRSLPPAHRNPPRAQRRRSDLRQPPQAGHRRWSRPHPSHSKSLPPTPSTLTTNSACTICLQPPAPAITKQENTPSPTTRTNPTELLRGGRVVGLGDVAKTQCWRGRAAVEVCKAFTHLVTHFSTHLGVIADAGIAPVVMAVARTPELIAQRSSCSAARLRRVSPAA